MHSTITACVVAILISESANAFSASPSDQHKCSLNPPPGLIVSRTLHTPAYMYAPSSTRLHIIGNLFGGGDDDFDKSKGELASFSNLEKSTADADVAFDSISTYVVDWAKLFEGDGGKERGLTTPVTVSTLNGPVQADGDDAQDDENEVLASSGIKFTFKPPKNAFEDKKDTDDGEKQGKKKKKETSSGGVLVQCQKIASGGGEVEIRLLASRCDIDEGTIIKEMSEQCIVDDLRKAVKIWRDERR